MPNRIIKESICTSEDIARLSKDAEILFYRLIVNADDFGRFFGNPSIVKSHCFPLVSDVIDSEVVDLWLEELARAGLLQIYRGPDGRRYLQLTKWDKHQTIRAKKSKFPSPGQNVKASASNCSQMKADESKCPRNPIQSNTNPIQFVSENARTREADQDDGFEAFWKIYPRKTGEIRGAYLEYVHALETGATKEQMMEALKWQAEEWDEEGQPQFIPSAEKWLKNRRWEEKRREKKPKPKSNSLAEPLTPVGAVDMGQLEKTLARI